MKNKLFCALLAILPLSGFAQDDFGTSLTVDVSKKLARILEIQIEEEVRFRNNSSEIERFSSTFDMSARLCKWIKAGGAYNLINFDHEKKGWEIRHRGYFYATGSYKLGRVKLSLRERWQVTYRQGVTETAKRANPKQYLRSRLQAEYNIPKCKFTPYVSAELFQSFNSPQETGLKQIRYIGGCEYKVNKRNLISVSYRYNDSMDSDDDGIVHMLCAGYSFKF